MEKIDIEQIMKEIRQEIKDKGFTNDMLSFRDVVSTSLGSKTLEEYYDILNSTWNIPAYRVFPNEKKALGKIKIFAKKILRKMMKFYIEPIAIDQSEFNANNVRLLNLLNGYMELNDRKIEMLESELEHLKRRLEEK